MTTQLSGREVWWNLVTGPREFIADTLDALARGDSVLVVTPGALPWEDEFWYQISEGIKELPGLMHAAVETLDADEDVEDADPIERLLREYALRDVELGYRIGVDGGRYLTDNHVLRNRIIHVRTEKEGNLSKWMDFCSVWPKGSSDTGLFIVECRDGRHELNAGNLRRINYSDYVTSYSVQLFNGLCLQRGASAVLSDGRRRYLASAITHLCDGDIEVAEVVARRLNNPPFDPIGAYKRAIETIGKDGRPKAIDDAELERRLWEAQVETVFSIVQRKHMGVVDLFRSELVRILSRHVITQYKKRITDPDDVEPGTLVYLMSAWGSEGRLLDVPDEKTRDEIHLLHDCRNALAHRRCCTDEQIRQLLD